MKFSAFKHIVLLTLIIGGFLFAYVVLVGEIKSLNRQKLSKEELLTEKLNKVRESEVEVQRLSSEIRVVEYAKDSLGLVRSTAPFEVLSVNEAQIKQIEKIINSKYD